jgi:hypothetical protein
MISGRSGQAAEESEQGQTAASLKRTGDKHLNYLLVCGVITNVNREDETDLGLGPKPKPWELTFPVARTRRPLFGPRQFSVQKVATETNADH